MLFWVVAALLTLAASLAVMLPLTRKPRQSSAGAENDIEVYRDQLREVERDAERGLIGAKEAEEAKAEIGRRILALAGKAMPEAASGHSAAKANDGPKPVRGKLARAVGAVAILSVPLVSWALYSEFGSPALPGQPLGARLAEDPSKSTPEELVARAEAHLANNPDDGRGWDVLAPIYMRGGRYPDAVTAYGNAVRLLGETGDRLSGLGEAQASAANGRITPEAEASFQRALAVEPANVKARFYLATALAQQDKLPEAEASWRSMLATLPADSPWRSAAEQAIAEVGRMTSGESPPAGGAAPAPGPSQEQIDAAASMSQADRTAMIEQMVSGLDAKLRENPRDAEGWARLVRSYVVLGKPDAARDALVRGLRALGDDSEDGKRLTALASSLGLTATE
jgi:cytochrome c-type biogenesis protein CcmH